MVMITVLLYPLQHNKNCITQNPLCSSPINYEYSFTFSQKFWPVILSRAMSISAEYFAKSCQGNRRVTKLHNNYITEYNRSYRRLFKCKNNDTIWSRVDPGRSKPSADYIPGNPSAHNISPSLSSALCHARPSKVRRPAGERSEEDDGTAAGPFTGARVHRWVDAPLSSGFSAVPYPLGDTDPSPVVVPLPVRHPFEHRQSWRVPSTQWRAAAQDLPARRADSSTPSGGGHGMNTMRWVPQPSSIFYFYSNKSPSSTCFE
jgi:hypothetical protein